MMIHLTKGNTEDVILTLTEKSNLATPNYLFNFINRTTNENINIVKLYTDDLSTYKSRYNHFSIVVNNYFSTATSGEWEYTIYEQLGTENLISLTTGIVEEGIMYLHDEISFTFTYYQTDNTFING